LNIKHQPLQHLKHLKNLLDNKKNLTYGPCIQTQKRNTNEGSIFQEIQVPSLSLISTTGDIQKITLLKLAFSFMVLWKKARLMEIQRAIRNKSHSHHQVPIYPFLQKHLLLVAFTAAESFLTFGRK
jgi:hypothetical protein